MTAVSGRLQWHNMMRLDWKLTSFSYTSHSHIPALTVAHISVHTSTDGPTPWRPQTMTATNHDGHSNENMKNQRHTFKKSPNSRQIHGHTVFTKHVCGHHGHCLWPSWSLFVAVVVCGRCCRTPYWLRTVSCLIVTITTTVKTTTYDTTAQHIP